MFSTVAVSSNVTLFPSIFHLRLVDCVVKNCLDHICVTLYEAEELWDLNPMRGMASEVRCGVHMLPEEGEVCRVPLPSPPTLLPPLVPPARRHRHVALRWKSQVIESTEICQELLFQPNG